MAFLKNLLEKHVINPVVKEVSTSVNKASDPKKTPVNAFQTNLYTAYQQSYGDFKKKPESPTDFDTLRNFSVLYDVARACINIRKSNILQLKWDITSVDEDQKVDDRRVNEVKEFFKAPIGPNRSFKDFLSIIIEDNTVLDAVVLHKDRLNNGSLYRLTPIDPATIEIIVTEDGRLPEPPMKAYKQVIDGRVVNEFTSDELYYEIENSRSSTPYGLSPMESLVLQVQASLELQNYNFQYFNNGNIPPGFLTMPESWKTDDIKEYQAYFDAELAGNSSKQHRIVPIPHGSQFTEIDRKDTMFFKDLELMILKKTCALFKVTPSEIGFTDDVNRATAEAQKDISVSQSIRPTVNFLEELFNRIIQEEFGYTDIQFSFETDSEDRMELASIYEKLVPIGIFGVDEARKTFNKEPIGVGNYVMNANSLQFITEGEEKIKDEKEENKERMDQQMNSSNNEEDDEEANKICWPEKEAKKEMVLWKKRCLRDMKYNKDKNRTFHSEFIEEETKKEIEKRLPEFNTREEVKKLFNGYIDNQTQEIVKDVLKLSEKINEIVGQKEDEKA